MNKEKAAEEVVMIMRSRLALMSPSREEARDLIKEYDLSGQDLLDAAVRLTVRSM